MVDKESTVVIDIIAIAALVLPIVLCGIMFWRSGSSINRLIKSIDDSGKIRDEIFSEKIGALVRSVSPRIIYCNGTSDVVREANSLIEKAVENFRKHNRDLAETDVSKNGLSLNEPPNKDGTSNKNEELNYQDDDFIAIYGSASLGTRETNDSVDDTADRFNKQMGKAMHAGIRFRRYVNLLKPNDLDGRSEKIQKQYAHWLGRQYDEIESSNTSELISNVRAPRWGTSNTSFLTNEGILEIKAGGGSALAVFDPIIAATMRASMREEIDKANEKNYTIYSAHTPGSIEKLAALVDEVCAKVGLDVQEVSRVLSVRKGDSQL